VDRVREEFGASGLAPDALPGNSAKLRLTLDLAMLASAVGPLRVLDVGCAGPDPLNLWLPFLPVRDRLELVGVDVAALDRTEARAHELGLEIELRRVGADRLVAAFGPESFDAVVTTQVLEHLRDWRRALHEMSTVLKPGGTLLVTCDSGDLRTSTGKRLRMTGKRTYFVLRRIPAVGRVGDAFVSGEWERGLPREELRAALDSAGFEIERLERYCLNCVKVAQRYAGSATRLLWLAMEEALAEETTEPVDDALYGILYARARRAGEGRAR
jgi:SAM-dependent methyltransferase